jgi:aspartate dehydrogenase
MPLDRLWENADLVVECAPAAHLRDLAEPTLANGRTLVTLSCGALLDNFDLVDLARRQGGRILVPTGALLALDAVQAAALDGGISRVQMITRKPPSGLEGAPHLVENQIRVTDLTEAKLVFSGTAREAARGFPANVNVAAALAMAGLGPDRTMIDIWADPAVDRNIHRIEVEADAARFSFQIENVPSLENPKTGRMTPLSVIALLRKLTSPLAIGT